MLTWRYDRTSSVLLMTIQNYVRATAWVFIHTYVPLSGQEANLSQVPDSATAAVVATSTSATTAVSRKTKRSFWEGTVATGGQLTLPFKIRPKAETQSFRLTTDVTIGAYIGLSKRLSTQKNYSLTIPFAAGLTFINLNSNNTNLDLDIQEAEVVPGITWCFGAILQLEQYSLGLLFGKDYASEVGNLWAYHRRLWWSFRIGFSFVRGQED
ncbi:MAG: hypothetical protein IPM98_03665 [Lewinellaceae bacterium]|nr:hypothetical protein [Lewinellaceae bacterium]